ncbi:MAG: hypothetical protein RL007_2058 [Bacteroidota bacterium]|jgi:predicted DsbA family dithiol-disulfide isomerase
MKKVSIEIWSDIACPFCYIGKKKLDRAIAETATAFNFEIIWKSFQLDPEVEFREGVTMISSLSQRKGWSTEQTESAFAHVKEMGQKYGLDFRFDKALPCNTMYGHLLIHVAQKNNLGSEMKESLFFAHFTNGINISSKSELVKIGTAVGLSEEQINSALSSDEILNEVKQDILEAQQLGIRGVPFFVFDRKFAVSGAQPDEVFVSALTKALE